MKIITRHQYLPLYPISADAEKLIVGTIHPHNHDQFSIPFFYGNRNSIWEIFSAAFPEELPGPITLEKVLHFLQLKKIAVSDTVLECQRQQSTYLDKDFIPTKLNTALVDDIRHSNIQEVFFTSGFGKNSAFKLFFVDILHKKITKDIREKKEVVVDPAVFGRKIKLRIIYSPSGSANIAWATSEMYKEKAHLYAHCNTPVHNFKVDYYRELFK